MRLRTLDETHDRGWMPHFTWLPVWVGRDLVWLQWVERRDWMGHRTFRPLDLENYP